MDQLTEAALERLSEALTDHSGALRRLRFKLEVQEAVIMGNRRWLAETTTEISDALVAVARAHHTMREQVAATAAILGRSPESTLREVVLAAPEPWDYILAEYRKDITAAVEHIKQISMANRQLLSRGRAAVTAALSCLGVERPGGYDATGAAHRAVGSIGLLNARS
jgi:hypothetical protein